jgi:two-component system phosphate regulon sensor histidine kinase PhoR
MAKRRLLYQIYPSYLLITLASLVGVGWYAAHSVEQFYLDSVTADLRARAETVREMLGSSWIADDADRAVQQSEVVAKASGIRLAILKPNGEVIADSTGKPRNIETQVDRREVSAAFKGRSAADTRFVPGLDQRVSFFALPIERLGEVVAVIHASQPIGHVDRAISQIELQIVLVGVAIALLGALISLWVSRGISKPIEQMRDDAERFARGELDYKLLVPDIKELAGLADALNQMASQLQERIATIIRQSNEQKAVVGSMVEGVFAVDNEERIISLNKATCQLLGIDEVHSQGRNLQEVIRNADLRRFVDRVLTSSEPIDHDVVLHGNPEGVLQARGAALHDATGRAIGAVVVLNDVTEFRRLEHIRRDFVANVSHELKTPVTSIKGFVETLLDGAVKSPEDTERFLTIVAKQADRLNAIIEDLLSLSKIEQGEDAGDIVLENAVLAEVLAAAVHDCQRQADERQIQVQMACDPDIVAHINGPLLEQAVINLLDNAIKYSEPGRTVQVLGSQSHREVTITVADRGCGISVEHLPRIFERFYRVDKARSRKLGGTGLGLAIVKHIVQAHGGRVAVKSELGTGSTFTINLPRPLAARMPSLSSAHEH